MSSTPDTIVLIHGLWMTPRSWEHWTERYESRGHSVLAPAWPGMEGEVEALNGTRPRSPSSTSTRSSTTTSDHPRPARAPPIIMGHSFGGAFTQILLDRGLGAAGVGVASATVKGVPDLPLTTLRATSPVLAQPIRHHKAVPLNEKQFQYAFANTLDPGGVGRDLRRYHVPAANPCSARAPSRTCTATRRRRSTSTTTTGRRCCSSHSARPHRPAEGHPTQQPRSTRAAVIAYKEFQGRPHFPGAPGWEEVADYALSWALDPKPLDTRDAARA